MNLLEYHLGKGVRAFSTLRNSGGVGEGAYASFNITPYCGDAPNNVLLCRTELAQELGITEQRVVLPFQTHTNQVKVVEESFFDFPLQEQVAYLEEVDALVTSLPGVCIGVSTADCVPILIYDFEQQVVAAVHAGWRGVVGHIAQNTVEEMKKLGSNVSDIRVVIGPSIGPASFEVGDEVVRAFLASNFPDRVILHNYVKPHIDLWASVAFELEEIGVSLQNVQIAGVDTFTHSDSFFSARQLGLNSGRIFSGFLLQ